jgi:hypothetical protein
MLESQFPHTTRLICLPGLELHADLLRQGNISWNYSPSPHRQLESFEHELHSCRSHNVNRQPGVHSSTSTPIRQQAGSFPLVSRQLALIREAARTSSLRLTSYECTRTSRVDWWGRDREWSQCASGPVDPTSVRPTENNVNPDSSDQPRVEPHLASV